LGKAVKRLAILIAVVLAAGIAAVAGASLVIPREKVREAVIAEIRAVTGLDPVLRGPVTVSMFPAGTISFSDVVLGEQASDPAFAVEQLTANLRLMPLLAGRIEIADISLVKPRIAVEVEPDGHTNWSALIDTLARALKPDAPRDERVLSFSEIRIEDGVIAIRNAGRNVEENLEAVELSLAWPSIARGFAAAGHLVWHGEKIDVSVSIADFPAALAGNNSGIKFRANAGPLKAAFDGAMSYEPSLKIDGTLAADAASLREALRWSGDRPLPAGGLGRFALKARTGVNGGTISLSNLNIEIDGNVAEGALSYATTGRQMLGTLAVEKLDLSPYGSAFRLIAENTSDWDSRSIRLDWFNGWDADVRLSAAGVHFSHADLGRTAIAANMRGGKLVITIGESQSFGGLITGSIAVAKEDTGTAVKSQMQFADIDMEQCLSQLFGLRRLEGTGQLTFSVESAGLNVQELARNLNGTAELVAKQGVVTGLNVDQLLRRLQRAPLSGNGDFRSGRTPFDKLNVGLHIAKGVAALDDVHLEGPSVRLALTGTTSIPERELDLSGTAGLIANPADANVTFELPFVVQGPWDNPLMLPDPQTLIRRSGATAPLLDALQDRRTRDAVRSTIERLTGQGGSGADRNPR
jgi:AsmA protein